MTKAERVARALQLFRFFVKIGFFTFGGGWSILAQMQSEFVERRQWLTQEELLDIVSVGRSLPGIMIANISALFGYHMGGALSAAAAHTTKALACFAAVRGDAGDAVGQGDIAQLGAAGQLTHGDDLAV